METSPGTNQLVTLKRWPRLADFPGVVITINSNKGGVGKTTITVMLAYYLASIFDELDVDIEIVLVDWDPQCNLSTTLGFHMDGPDGHGERDDEGNVIRNPLFSVDDIITVSTEDVKPGAAEDMLEPIRWVITNATGRPILHPETGQIQPDPINKRIKLLPGHPDLALRHTLISEPDFRFRLDHSLDGIKRCRIFLVDTGPGMGPLVETAMAASDSLLGVTPLYYNEMEGVVKTRNRLRAIRRSLQRPNLDMDGVVINEHAPKRVTQRGNTGILTDHLGHDRVWLEQAIPEVEQIATVVDQGKSFGRIYGKTDQNKIHKAGRGLAHQTLDVIANA